MISHDHLQSAGALMRALAHPLRLEILFFIDQGNMVCVNKIYNALQLEQSITSQHLKILRNAELVKTKKEGKFVYYSVNYDKIRKINNIINEFVARNKNIEDLPEDFEVPAFGSA